MKKQIVIPPPIRRKSKYNFGNLKAGGQPKNFPLDKKTALRSALSKYAARHADFDYATRIVDGKIAVYRTITKQ